MVQLDTSSSSIIPSEQPPPPEEAFTFMDSDMFKAAEDGNMEPFNSYQGGLNCPVDGGTNTALHIYSRTGGREVLKTDKSFLCLRKTRSEREISTNFVQQLVDKCPSLLLQPNARGEIPLHIAAKHGHYEMVKFLIERAKEAQREDVEKGISSEATSSRLKQMLRIKDKEGNTAFHKAAGSGDARVVQLLVEELDPDYFSFSTNNRGETPLYIAAKRRGNHLVVTKILVNCKSMHYGGPDGTTALHVAVMEDKNDETVGKLIKAKEQLTKETDDKGWTPLHYAAYFGVKSATKLLLEADASAAYITDKERGISPLHIATWQGHKDIMEDIISHCPGCCEISDKKSWNFLHIAVVVLKLSEIERFLLDYKKKNKDLTITNLLDQKDINGNTPLHALIYGTPPLNKASDHSRVLNLILSRASDKSVYHMNSDSEIKKGQMLELLEDIANNVEVAGSPLYKLRKYVKKMEEKEEAMPGYKIREKASESHLLVATLVATVTFAAAFTVPGGYKSEQGTATLSHDSAFKAFVITDTLAFVSSLLAIFLHFLFALSDKRERRTDIRLFDLADWLTFFAMVAMVIAFSAGSYAVLKSSLEFAIATCSLGLIFFPGLLIALRYSFS